MNTSLRCIVIGALLAGLVRGQRLNLYAGASLVSSAAPAPG
jgi:hypothetical protein